MRSHARTRPTGISAKLRTHYVRVMLHCAASAALIRVPSASSHFIWIIGRPVLSFPVSTPGRADYDSRTDLTAPKMAVAFIAAVNEKKERGKEIDIYTETAREKRRTRGANGRIMQIVQPVAGAFRTRDLPFASSKEVRRLVLMSHIRSGFSVDFQLTRGKFIPELGDICSGTDLRARRIVWVFGGRLSGALMCVAVGSSDIA